MTRDRRMNYCDVGLHQWRLDGDNRFCRCMACPVIFDRGIGPFRIRVPAWRRPNEDGAKRPFLAQYAWRTNGPFTDWEWPA